MMNAEPIPMSSPDITNVEREAVAAVLRTPNLSMGSEIEAMESGIREYLGCKHAIAVNSGTAGLHLCVRAAGIGAGDLVLTTPFSFVASTNVLLFERAVPIFLDVDPVTGNPEPRAAGSMGPFPGRLTSRGMAPPEIPGFIGCIKSHPAR